MSRITDAGIHGLSQLNVWWLRLGIQHQRSRPASPQDNGAHERMHKTLKAEAIRPPRATLAPQQRAFNRFRAEYNHERPHQFLDGATPASRYRTSPRPYTGTLPPIEYPGHFIVKRITNAGTFRFKKKLLFIANSLKQHTIGPLFPLSSVPPPMFPVAPLLLSDLRGLPLASFSCNSVLMLFRSVFAFMAQQFLIGFLLGCDGFSV